MTYLKNHKSAHDYAHPMEEAYAQAQILLEKRRKNLIKRFGDFYSDNKDLTILPPEINKKRTSDADKIVFRGLIVTLVMILVSAIAFVLDVNRDYRVGTTLLCVTASLVQLYAYAYWMERRDEINTMRSIVNPAVLPYTVMLTLLLAIIIGGSILL